MFQVQSYAKAPCVVLKSLFDRYDSDKNGKLNKEELYAFLENDLGLNTQQAETYLLLFDKDADGSISYKEFENWFRSGEKFESINDLTRYYYLQKMVEFFKKYDTDHNNAIDQNELRQLFEEYGGKDRNTVEGFMKQLDLDGNGLVSFEEFACWLHWVPTEELIVRRNSFLNISSV